VEKNRQLLHLVRKLGEEQEEAARNLEKSQKERETVTVKELEKEIKELKQSRERQQAMSPSFYLISLEEK